ncbi:glycosyltransferase family 4 protein [Knoellia koreensis]|uniref:D-inositol 3-phosphate glycosyltransferase n=1 Tax=Knoellia koreensis TaxID=2730921 RepID=A0A849HJ50_9MICO|nr:glycosyltransferase family 4 protein [Knoellia sp. DB2414S]NNM44697.1 glycosyltransferase family 4 protein [Knoellia sp. DB2414S]
MVLGKSTGGIGTHVVELTAGLRGLGDRVEVVTDAVTAERFGLREARRWWPGRAAGLVGSVRRVWWLRGLARESDVVHAHGHQAGLVSAVAMLGLSTPLVVSQHNAVLARRVKGRLLGLAQRFVARRATLVTGASSDLVDEAERFGAREPRLAPVPSPRVAGLLATQPLDESGRRALARELLQENGIDVARDTPMVLTIARIAPQKNLGVLVDAAAQLSTIVHLGGKPTSTTFHLGGKPPVWVVVGGGDEPLREELVARARSRGVPVHLVGPQDDPERWLRAADVFVLTSTWEARALVVQEAMAAGVPVVATDTGGLHDLVEGVGTLVPVGDADAVSRAVESYLGDAGARHTDTKAARERAETWGDDEATARRWQEWYRGLLGMT